MESMRSHEGLLRNAFLKIIGGDVEEAAGPLQLCAGQDGGCEAAIYMLCEALFKHLRPKLCF